MASRECVAGTARLTAHTGYSSIPPPAPPPSSCRLLRRSAPESSSNIRIVERRPAADAMLARPAALSRRAWSSGVSGRAAKAGRALGNSPMPLTSLAPLALVKVLPSLPASTAAASCSETSKAACWTSGPTICSNAVWIGVLGGEDGG